MLRRTANEQWALQRVNKTTTCGLLQRTRDQIQNRSHRLAKHAGSLFNDAVRSPDSIASNYWVIDNELEKIRKEAPFSLIKGTFSAIAWSKKAENLRFFHFSTKLRPALKHIYLPVQ
jgi:hypothetical protein